MKYLLFDQSAISTYIADTQLQSVEYSEGKKFVQHICGELQSAEFHNTVVDYCSNGIQFVGLKRVQDNTQRGARIFCIDLEQCNIMTERENPARLLTLIQKTLRLALKIWDRHPFSLSERYYGSKSILFPFPQPDHSRIVIERSNTILRLTNRGIDYPLLAYKYNDEEPAQAEDVVNTSILREAGEVYASTHNLLINKYAGTQAQRSSEHTQALELVESTSLHERSDFIYWGIDRQYQMLTDSQRAIVDYDSLESPLRIEGAAGTGKTISMIMRAYRLLKQKESEGKPFKIAFFAHSESTSIRNKELFSYYGNSAHFLDASSAQSICFETLLSFCSRFARIADSMLLESDALESKNYQLLLIYEAVHKAISSKRLKTYLPILSQGVKDLFDEEKTHRQVLYNMLQHEFSVQIKGRTDCTIDNYYDIKPIENGLPCVSKADKEFVFSIFVDYQKGLQDYGTFDVDDVTMEALSRLNAPIWRRERVNEGFDYIFADEMHLFNINEQSVFHFLTKTPTEKEVPICFALDYAQAIGDLGDVSVDYIFGKAFGTAESKNLHTVFRSSPQIAELCASIAASGTLMFGANFANPYNNPQYCFTSSDEEKAERPKLLMYENDDQLVENLNQVVGKFVKTLQCKLSDIAIICFDEKWLSQDGVAMLEKQTGRQFSVLDKNEERDPAKLTLSSPYSINGLEFQGVILIGVDEGRVPQTSGTSDISRHFIMYSAYNMLYLTISRARFMVTIMGTKLNGISSCLDHSLNAGYLEQVSTIV